MLRQELESRLKVLRAEYASGKRGLAETQNKEASLKQTLERISGAIKEIEEKLKTAT